MHAFVDDLLDRTTGPVVTVTAALDRAQPGSEDDRIRVRNLLAVARTRISTLADQALAERLSRHLEAAAADVDLGGGAQGLVVVVTPDAADVRPVPFPVRDSVSMGPTPATRGLVQGLRRSPRYRVLVLSDRGTRLFEAIRDDLAEVTDHGFPLAKRLGRRDRRAIAGRYALPSGPDGREQRKRFYRQIDRALTEASRGDDLPLVLVGVRRSIRLFQSLSASARRVAGTVDGAHDELTPTELGRVVWPVMQAQLEARRAEAIDALADAAATGGATTGIDEVWQLAREGRGRLLVVEEDYRAQPAREVDGRLEWTDDVGPDVLDDPVDEVVEHVVRAGGSVEFVAPGAIAHLGHIGLLLR